MAFDCIELPEPFRSDWRTAYMVWMLVQVMGGKGRTRISVGDIYEDMRKLFNVIPEDADDAKVDSALKAWLPTIGATKVSGGEHDPEKEFA